MGFFKQRKPRQFQLKPRYYDEHKERVDASMARARKELGLDPDPNQPVPGYEDRIRGKFRENLEEAKDRKHEKMRWGIYIGIALLVIYVLYTNFVG